MNLFKRGSAIAAGTLLTVVLTSCSGGTDAPKPAPQPQESSGSAISNPKNASSVDVCQLLPPEGASAVGVNPTGELDDTPKISSDVAEACVWETSDGAQSVSLSVLTDRSIKDYYDNKSQYPDYQEMTIAGYPAVRANDADPTQSGSCSIYAAVGERQMLTAFSMQADVADPCAVSQKALEASIPTLPAAK